MKNAGTKSRLLPLTKMTMNGPFIQIHMYLHISKIKRSGGDLTSQQASGHDVKVPENIKLVGLTFDSPRPNHKLFLIA
jgi:hypothetical protein